MHGVNKCLSKSLAQHLWVHHVYDMALRLRLVCTQDCALIVHVCRSVSTNAELDRTLSLLLSCKLCIDAVQKSNVTPHAAASDPAAPAKILSKAAVSKQSVISYSWSAGSQHQIQRRKDVAATTVPCGASCS